MRSHLILWVTALAAMHVPAAAQPKPDPADVKFRRSEALNYAHALGDRLQKFHNALVAADALTGLGGAVCRDECQSVVYFNDGHGNFTRKQPFGPPGSSTRAMAVADFDGDGRLDIAACHEGLGLFVYFNTGKGNFGPGVKIAGGDALPYSMLAADLNNDGRPEIIVGYVGAPGAIYFNDGSGRNYSRVAFGDSQGAIYGLAAGDLDGDGYLDIVAARSDAPSMVFFSRPVR